jgi:protein TonB
VAVRPADVAPASESILARIQAVPDAAARRAESPPLTRREPQPARLPALDPRTESSGPSAVRHAPTPATAALPAVEMPLLADPTWYPAAQLDVFPAALAPVRPAYPEAAAQADIGGEVTLLLLIDESGRVHESTAVDAQPQGTFEEAALGAFRAARFTPGQRDGRNVRSRVLVKVVFNPAEAGAAVSR